MTKLVRDKLYWQIQGLFNKHVGCLAEGCHCSGDATAFADDLTKLLNHFLPLTEEIEKK